MLAKLITLINNEILQIVLSVFFGVLLIADSYRPPFRRASGSSPIEYLDSFSLALGVALIVVAYLIYRKWSSGMDSK
jgi:hypothetical protein